jgi:urate oxidase
MSATLGDNRYGKAGIRLFRVLRDTDRHEVADLTVDVYVEGGFDEAHTAGDNTAVLPTDTMRGTVHAFARDRWDPQPEVFGMRLAQHFVDTVGSVERATVHLTAAPWERITVGGGGHDHAFTGRGGERRAATATVGPEGAVVAAGLADLLILKTTRSGFSDFHVDEYTTLEETDDRILATLAKVDWRYTSTELDWAECARRVREVLLSAFATHDSRSLQHTLYAMGQAVLDARPEVDEITMSMPNKHHVLSDLSPYGLDNPGEVFVVTDRPFGVIEGTVRRRE